MRRILLTARPPAASRRSVCGLAEFASCLAILALAGCHEPFSNEDILFLKSLPRGVQFDVPGDADSTSRGLSPEETMQESVAMFYAQMVQTSTSANKQIFDVLKYIETLTSSSATVRDDNRRAWGPLRPDPKEKLELLLVVDRIKTATAVRYTSLSEVLETDVVYSYAFSGRPNSSAEWMQFLYGESVVLSADTDDATGYFCVDLDVVRMLNPQEEGSGTYCASYDFRGDQQTVELAVRVMGSLYVNPDAAFSLHYEGDGSGRVFFSQRGNVFPEDDVSRPEITSYTVRWDASLAARTDASICGGDTQYELWATECWDERFLRSFFLSNIPGAEYAPFGSLKSCPAEFQEPDAIAQPCRE